MEVSRFTERITASRGAEYPCTLFTGERVLGSLRLKTVAYSVGANTDGIMLSLIAGARYRTRFGRRKVAPHLTFRVYDLSNDGGGVIQPGRPAGPGSLVLMTNILLPGVVT